MTNKYQEKRKEILATFPQIPSMSNYEMVIFLQKQFNHKENDTSSTDLVGLDSAMHLLREENRETNTDAERLDFEKFRDGIGDQVTIAYFLAFKLADLRDENFPLLEENKRPNNYTEYRNNVNEKLRVLDNLVVGLKQEVGIKDGITQYEIKPSDATVEQKQAAFREYMTALHSLPLSSKINIRNDLIEITLSSLSKICKTYEIAEQTLKQYQDKGYLVHIEKSENGWIILVSEDCVVNGDFIPQGKFLKAVDWQESVLEKLDEDINW